MEGVEETTSAVGEVAEAEVVAPVAVDAETTAGQEMNPDHSLVTFDNVYLYFTREEWELLTDGQRSLYFNVVTENFLTVLSLGLPISRSHVINQPEQERTPRDTDREPRETERTPRVHQNVDSAQVRAEMIEECPGPDYPLKMKYKEESESSEQDFSVHVSDVRSLNVCPSTIEEWPGPDCSHSVQCKESESSEQDFSVHVSDVRTLNVGPSIEKDHHCDRCDPIFKEILHLSGQQETCSWQQPYPCNSCGRTFWVTINHDHILKQQNTEEFSGKEKDQASAKNHRFLPCREGEKDFLANLGLGQDQVAHNGDNKSDEYRETFHTGQRDHKCGDGRNVFSRKKRLAQHQKIHCRENPDEYSSECGSVFNHDSSLLFKKINNTESYSVLDNGEKLFDPSSDLTGNQSYPVGSRPYNCAECGKSFITKSYLRKHQKIHSGIKFKCSDCNKAFSRKDSLNHHRKTHNKEQPYICSSCGKAFTQKDALAEHQRSHTGQKSFICDECGKQFCHSSYVKIHKRIHSGIRPYPCKECGKSFIRKSHLTQHQRTHTGIKSYKCNDCKKTFYRKYSLNQHQKTHNNKKPYICTTCEKAFSRKDRLSEHAKNHNSEASCVCDECSKVFCHSSYLKIHKRIHSGTRPYACEQCEKAYITQHHLVNHKKIHTTGSMGESNVENSASTTNDITKEQDLVCPMDIGNPEEGTPAMLGTPKKDL